MSLLKQLQEAEPVFKPASKKEIAARRTPAEQAFEKNKAEYIKHPNNCPFCGSDDISADDDLYEGNTILREIDCNACEERWYEVFTLTDIQMRD